jgi:hypothetical protein
MAWSWLAAGCRDGGSIMKTMLLTATTLFAVLALGCGAEADGGGVDELDTTANDADTDWDDDASLSVDGPIDTQQNPLCEYRSDFVGSITPSEGYWGNWAPCFDWCPQTPIPSFALWPLLKSEGPQGSGDDTGLNGVAFTCMQWTDPPAWAEKWNITSTVGGWGSWGNWHEECGGSVVVGAKMMVEPPQGKGDDTAANRIALKCKNGTWVYPDSKTAWGSWQTAVECPSGSAVCGMRTRVEPSQGSGDDTALNGMELACCTLPPG